MFHSMRGRATLGAGEIVGLIGPNGAGKTTVLECLAGLLPADAGSVHWAGEVLDFVGLSGRASALAGDLTPPEKRRLEVARALATEPKLLLLDEVLTGLTPVEAQRGVDLVRRVRETGVTVLMVEHVMEVVMPLVDRAFVLHLGRELAHGKPADVVRDENVLSAYLGDRHRAA